MRHHLLLIFLIGAPCSARLVSAQGVSGAGIRGAAGFTSVDQLVSVPAADTVLVDLTAALERALEVSPDLLAQLAKARYAEARLDQAQRSRYLTDLKATSAQAFAPGISNPNNTPTDRLYLDPDVRNDWDDLRPFARVDVDLVQPLWTWGQLGRTIDAARAGVAVEESGAQITRLEVARRTGEMYYSVVLLEALDRLTTEATDAVSRARKEVVKLLDAGDAGVDDADLFQVQITEQEIVRRVAQIQQELQTARTALRRQLLLPEGSVVETRDRFLDPLPLPSDSLDYFLALAEGARPELSQASAGIEARRALVDVARSEFYPKLVWGVHSHYSFTTGRYRQRNPYVGDSFLSRSLETGLGIRLQLNFTQTRAKVEQARANLQEVLHLEVGARELVLFQVEQAYRKMRYRASALASTEEALRISRDWLQTEYVNFDLDLGDTDNLIKAVQANLELQAARHQAVFDLNMAVLGLYKASGMLDSMMAR